MTSDTQAAIALFSLLSLAIIWKLLGEWNHYRIAALRQDLFELRDKLFDVGCRTPFLFEAPAYRMQRELINAYIRFAHKFSTTRLIVVLLTPQRGSWLRGRWMDLLSDLPESLRREFERIQRAAHFRLACHVFHIPMPVAWWLLDSVKVVSNDVATKAKEEIADKIEMLEVQATEEYELESRVPCAAGAGH